MISYIFLFPNQLIHILLFIANHLLYLIDALSMSIIFNEHKNSSNMLAYIFLAYSHTTRASYTNHSNCTCCYFKTSSYCDSLKPTHTLLSVTKIGRLMSIPFVASSLIASSCDISFTLSFKPISL